LIKPSIIILSEDETCKALNQAGGKGWVRENYE
jgi:hypothetical protein